MIYPNYKNDPPGRRVDFWHYQPDDGRRWYIYGGGSVSADGKQVVPDRGVYLYELSGAMFGSPQWLINSWRWLTDPGWDGDPVHLGTGLFVMRKTDLRVSDTLPIGIDRTNRPNDTFVRSFGIGSSLAYDMFLVGDRVPWTYAVLVLPGGARVEYARISLGTGYADAVFEHTSSGSAFYKSRISWNGNGWNLDLKDGSRIVFPDGFNAVRPAQAAALRFQDRFGNAVVLTRNADGELTRITSPNGRFIDLTYDSTHRITQATDHINRSVQYTYDASGRLWKVTDVLGGVTEYTYDASHRMLTIKDPRNIVYLTNEYDAGGRVIRQVQADGSDFEFAYTLDGGGNVTQVDVTDPRGSVRRAVYNAAGYLTSDTRALGQSVQQTATFDWQAGTNFLLSTTDALGRQTALTYDGFANLTSVTRLAGTGNAVTETYTYESTFQQVASRTDALNRVTTFEYNAQGGLIKIRDPLNRETVLTRNSEGLVTSITNPMNHQVSFDYLGGDLVSQSDPLGRTTSFTVDSVGRVLAVANPLGQQTQYEYNAFDNVVRITDAIGGQTTMTYDGNANLLTLTDARGKTTTYTYDSMDRVATRRDPLLRQESYGYDGTGNLTQITDRKSQVTTYAYDPLNRLVSVGYQDGSSTGFTLDAGDRLTQITDSIAGTISRTYDLLDRMLSETTPEGAVSYTFDAVDRRTSMTVAGQPIVSYAYNGVDQITSITQGSSSITFAYDNANRRTSHTLPNGIVVEYAHDAASQLTGLTYKLGQSTLGNLTYAYDPAGNPTTVGGTWARTSLPTALASATYDDANQVTQFGGAAFTYDANGNLTADGTGTYTWNARDQLTAVTGVGSGTFTYDAIGRRRAKTVGGTTTQFLHDGLDPVRELTGGSPVANILGGLEIDEVFLRTDGAGARALLTDALGSTVALADGTGGIPTEYTYQPFGSTITAGAPTSNPFGFTGREADGTGLYYYRTRFHDPRSQRFLSEDAIGLVGGFNLFAYVLNNPLGFRDPLGLQRSPAQGQPPDAIQWHINKDGSITRREFGPDGRAVRDTDYGQRHGPKHEVHDWDWTKTPPRQPGEPAPKELPPGPSRPTGGPEKPGNPPLSRIPFPRIPLLPLVVNPCFVRPEYCIPKPNPGRKAEGVGSTTDPELRSSPRATDMRSSTLTLRQW